MGERIHFGALKLQDRDGIAQVRREGSEAPRASGALSESAQRNIAQREAVIHQMEQARMARSIAVPTKESHVKLKLRELGQPICLFGEGPSGRRERLRRVMVERGLKDGFPALLRGLDTEEAPEIQQEAFITEGTKELKEARRKILQFSLPRAKKRVEEERALYVHMRDKAEALGAGDLKEVELEDDIVLQEVRDTIAAEDKLKDSLRKFTNVSSEIGEIRALSSCAFQPTERPSLVATGSWSGRCKIWEMSSLKEQTVLEGHTDMVTDLSFHPHSGTSQSPQALNLATCSADHTIKLWSMESSQPLTTLEGHPRKVSKVAFHPSGEFLASSSFDHTWRLWSVEKGENLLIQEGHAHPVTSIAFHQDGSLLVSAGTDHIARIWDLRSGRSIMTLKGHIKPVFATAFSPNGYHMATGSGDHAIRVWDLRKRRCIHTIPAHSKLVSSLCYQPGAGNFLVSASFDRTCKVWDASDFTPLRTLAGHEEKVMSVDVSRDSSTILSSGYDRTWKLWSEE